jgi:hypothetical protein
MRRHAGAARVVSVVILGTLLLAAVSLRAQAPSSRTTAAAAPKTHRPAAIPRTADGRPDLQGTWDFAQLTPFERPGDFAGKTSLTDQEAEEFAQQRIETSNKDKRDGTAAADVERAYNDFWWDFGTRIARQPSLVVDPPDGRLPALTPAAEKRVAERKQRYENPEERPMAERCILGFNSGPPMVPSAYNNNVQIVQTKGHVLIFNEMIHSARLVDMSGRPHPPESIRYLTGHSIGKWEGDTLVVDTTNYARENVFRNSSTKLHLIERFTREDAQTLRYEFTVDDPEVWTKRWTASIPMSMTDNMMFEYACHEANYALEGVLKGARFQEKNAGAAR